MGLTLNILEMMLEVVNKKNKTNLGSVVDLGAQDLYCNNQEFYNFFGKEYNGVLAAPPQMQCSAEIAYLAAGFAHYECIDFSGEHNAHKFDLNFDIKDKYNFSQKFDLVYNGGTSEHCFNQYTFFENTHNLCKTGGIMFHVVPMHGGNSHGFVNYHPMMFARMAYANSYLFEGAWIFSSDGQMTFNSGTGIKEYYENFKIDYNDPASSILFCVALRKQKEEKFEMPYQCIINSEYENGWAVDILSDTYKAKIINEAIDGKPDVYAVFGCGVASNIATMFLKRANLNISYYVDDFKSGTHNNTAIINREDFIDKFGTSGAVIFIGPNQLGDYKDKFPENIKIVELKSISFI